MENTIKKSSINENIYSLLKSEFSIYFKGLVYGAYIFNKYDRLSIESMYDYLNDNKDIFQYHSTSLQLREVFNTIEIYYHDDSEYIRIKQSSSRHLSFQFENESLNPELYVIPKFNSYSKNVEINIKYSSGVIFVKKNKHFIPLNGSNYYFLIVGNSILERLILFILNYKKEGFIFTDDILNNLKSQDNIMNLKSYKSYKELLRKELFKEIPMPKWATKYPLKISAFYLKIYKKTREADVGILKNYFYQNIDEINFKVKNGVDLINESVEYEIEDLINDFYFQKVSNYVKSANYGMVKDYINMVVKRRFKVCKFNLRITSIKRLKEEHNKLAYVITESSLKSKKLVKYQFNKQNLYLIKNLGKDLKMTPIKTNRELFLFSKLMSNCISDYSTRIKNNKCIVFRGIYEDEEHCILIKYRKDKYKLVEIKKKFDGSPNLDYVKLIQKNLDIL